MIDMNMQDLIWCVNRLPNRIKSSMKDKFSALWPVIAGGYIRACIANEHVNDIDMFVVGPPCDSAILTGQLILGTDLEPHESENAYSINLEPYPVQVIRRWTYDKLEDVINSFDFTICQAALWYDKETKQWIGKVADGFYEDLAAKRLNYTAPDRDEDAGGSMLRVLKYYQRGYRIPMESLGKVLARMVSGLSEEDFGKRSIMDKKQWEGVVGLVMTGLLREVDPQIDPNRASHLPSTFVDP